MFGNESLPGRVYAYRAYEPIAGLDQVADQLRAAQFYRNTLVEIERRRREARVDLWAARVTGYAAINDRLRAIDAERRAKRAAGPDAPGHRTYQAIGAEERGLETERRRLKRAARAAGPDLVHDLAAIDAAAHAAVKAARAATATYWGTYLKVEDAMKRGFKDIVPEEVSPPFRGRPECEGLWVQLQRGLSWSAATLGADQRLRIEILPATAGGNWNRSAARPWRDGRDRPAPIAGSNRSARMRRAIVWFRVGSDGRDPIWAKVPVRLHRLPPPAALIKWAHLRRIRTGAHVKWEFQLVLGAPSWDRDDQATVGVVGVDLNWRRRPDGLRVAVAIGSDDGRVALTIPDRWLSAWAKADSLRSIRDREFNAARDRLRVWMAEHAGEIPDWLAEATRTIALWRKGGAAKLSAIARRWRASRFAGDDMIYVMIEAYRVQEAHLADYEAGVRSRAIRRRNDRYRKFARALARSYHAGHLEAMDCRRLRQRPTPEEKEDGPTPELQQAARRFGQIAAIGTLRQYIVEAMAAVAFQAARDTTRRCHACGVVNQFDAAANLEHTCVGCGVRWDQDDNAAINLRDGTIAIAAARPEVVV